MSTKHGVGSYHGTASYGSSVLILKSLTDADKEDLITTNVVKETAALLDWMNCIIKVSAMGISFEDMLKFSPSIRGDLYTSLVPQARSINLPNLLQPYLQSVSVTKNPNNASIDYDQAISSSKRINVPMCTASMHAQKSSEENGKMTLYTVGYEPGPATAQTVPAGSITQRSIYEYDDDEFMVTMEYSCPSISAAQNGVPAHGNSTITTFTTMQQFFDLQDLLMKTQNETYNNNLDLGFGSYSLTEIRNELPMVVGFYIDSIFPLLDRLLNFEIQAEVLGDIVEDAGYSRSDAFVIAESIRPSNMMVQQTKMLAESVIKSAPDNQDGIDMPSGGDISTYMGQLTPAIKGLIEKLHDKAKVAAS